METKQFAYVLITSLLFLKLALAASSAEAFEIKFSPSGEVYRGTLSEDRRLYDCVLHNVAVINRSNSPIVLQRIELQLLRKGEVIQTRYVLSQELESRAQRAFTLFEQGALAEAEKEFRIKELFQNATLSRSNRLEPNKGLLIRDQYLQFGGDVEKIRVIAVGDVGDGSVVQSAGEISLISYQPKTKTQFPAQRHLVCVKRHRCFGHPSLGHRSGVCLRSCES